MNKLLTISLILFLSAMAVQSPLYAQSKEAAPSAIGCIDPKVRQQAEYIKQHYLKQGFVTERDAMLNMSSMQSFPVMLQLNKGRTYEIIYVGQETATNHIMEFYDGNQKKLYDVELYKKKKQLPDNYIIYEFTPDRTDTYLLAVMTKLKQADFCGSLSVLMADPSKPGFVPKPYHHQ